MYVYKTISQAITDLRKRGYRIDFNLGLCGVYTHSAAFSLPLINFK